MEDKTDYPISRDHSRFQAEREKKLNGFINRFTGLRPFVGKWALGCVQRQGFKAIHQLNALEKLLGSFSVGTVEQACARSIANDQWRLADLRRFLPDDPRQFSFSDLKADLFRVAPPAARNGQAAKPASAPPSPEAQCSFPDPQGAFPK